MGKKNEDEEESCMSCVLAVSLGEYLKVCKEVDGKKQCKKLMNQIVNEEITPKELFETIRKHVKKGSKQERELNEVDSFIIEEFANAGKHKKKKSKKR